MVVKLGERRTLFGEREQAACNSTTKERMSYQNISEMAIVVGNLWCPGTLIVSTRLAWLIAWMSA